MGRQPCRLTKTCLKCHTPHVYFHIDINKKNKKRPCASPAHLEISESEDSSMSDGDNSGVGEDDRDYTIKEHDVLKAIKDLKVRKAAGLDSISNAMIKSGQHKLVKPMTKNFNKIQAGLNKIPNL